MSILETLVKNSQTAAPLPAIRNGLPLPTGQFINGLPLPTGQFINADMLSPQEKARIASLGVPDVKATPAQLPEILNEIAKDADTFVPSLSHKGMTQAQIRERLAKGTTELPPEEAAKVQDVIRDYYEQNKQAAEQNKPVSVTAGVPDLSQKHERETVRYEFDPTDAVEPSPVVNPTTTSPNTLSKPEIVISETDLVNFVMGMASNERFKKTYTTTVGAVSVSVVLREMITDDVFYMQAALRQDFVAKIIQNDVDIEFAKKLYLLAGQLDSLVVGNSEIRLLNSLSELDELGTDRPPLLRLRQVIAASPLQRETLANLVQDLLNKFVPYTLALSKKVYSPN